MRHECATIRSEANPCSTMLRSIVRPNVATALFALLTLCGLFVMAAEDNAQLARCHQRGGSADECLLLVVGR